MSSGYVTTTSGRKPDVVKSKSSRGDVNLSQYNSLWRFNVDEWKCSNPITSFRSGPSYEFATKKPGAIFGSTNLNEFYASIAGDIGHEFSMKKVTRLSGNTTSRRPSPVASPYWSIFTNPVPVILLIRVLMT